ncbi:putative methyltransferase NSUN7 isoform X2 [Chiloscyllium plagiosum]|uniref:putative methyltransferase NSUN7 isoform X2 n=1 Tax=Chiloscyllium plagiosum TaxID=36176 RepID=UPI001CB80E6E|nr:putative methyltransferase NSUN7 isoform X2 [Chiloscyllium plagiosum]
MSHAEYETSSLSEVTSETSNLDELTISRKTRADEKDLALHREKTGYPDYVYKVSADIFQSIHVEKPLSRRLVNYEKDPEMIIPEIKDEKFQRWVYELAFSALKYQDVLEEVLINSCFYPTQQISLDSTSLVVIMLYDYQDRKFQPRTISEAEENVIPVVRKVEKSLYSFKTKLAAALARCRIKNDAISIDLILPESVRNQERRASFLPLYAWINVLKTSLEEVTNLLEREGFTKVKCPQQLEGLTFCEDRHCQDVVLFPTHLTAKLYEMELVTSYKMVIQDKGRSLAPHSVKVLMNMDDDIVVTNAGSRLTVAHMSTLISQSTSKVFVCGVKSELQQLELKSLFEKVGCKNTTLLQELSQGKVSEEKLKQLAQKQAEELMHAIKFPKVQAIVYSTCSIYPEENEEIVKPVLGKKMEGPRVQPYRLSAPVIPLCCPSEITCASDKFFKIEPSEQVNGCFIAVLTRERDPSGAVSVKDVLARAAAKGLLDGVETPRVRKKEEKRKKNKVFTPKMVSFSGAQSRITEFLNEQKSVTVNGTSTASQQLSRSEASTTGSSIKLTQRVPIPTLPNRVKRNISNAASVGRLASRKGISTGTKQELKLVLKPVEMLLPPVTIRYLNSNGVQNHGYNQPYLFQYHGLTSQPAFPYSRNAFVTSLGVKKQRDTGIKVVPGSMKKQELKQQCAVCAAKRT